MPKILAILPAYNEEKNIEKVLKEAKIYFKNILVVDDGSKDRTFEIAKKYTKNIIKHEINKGKAEAIKSALKKFVDKYDIFVIVDSDGQYSVKDSLNLVNLIKNGYDIATGYRNFSKIPFRHALANRIWRSLFNLLYKTRLKDVSCGLIAFNKNFAKEILGKIHGGYILEASILITAIRKNFKIGQVKVDVKYKKISNIRRGVRMFLGISTFIILNKLFSKQKFNF